MKASNLKTFIIYLFVLNYLLFSSSALFAADSVYCPESIICAFNGSIDSCKIKYISDPKYFGKLAGEPTGYTLGFASVTAGFHSTSSGKCFYSYTSSGGGSVHRYVLTLDINPEANLEASNQEASKWVFSQTAICEGSSTRFCPLKDRLGFILHNINITDGVTISTNGRNLNEIARSSQYASITDEDALIACGNVTQCNLDIISGKSLKYGSIKIDVNTMRILEIKNLVPTKIKIQKIDPFNSIEIGYVNSIFIIKTNLAEHTKERLEERF